MVTGEVAAGPLVAVLASLCVALAGIGATLSSARRHRNLLVQVDRLDAAVEAVLDPFGHPDATGVDPLALPSLAPVPGPLEGLERRLRRLQAIVLNDRRRVDLLERAVRAVPEGLVLTDEHEVEAFRNDAASEIAGGRQGDALVDAAVRELVSEALRRGRQSSRTLDLRGPPKRTLVVSARPVLAEDRPVGGLAIISDITERRRLEAIRRDFVANISHELKTPVGALSLLAETIVSEDDPQMTRRLAERMVAEATRLAHTIEDLLVLSRIESEERPRHEMVPIRHVVAEAVNRIRPAADNARIKLDVREPDHDVAVRGDRRQLVSALYNLLDNAVKYSDSGSEVTIQVTDDRRNVEMIVRDRGIGIPAKDTERVFERFYRVDVARSRQTGGTGLGLSIVRHVMANHGGEVRVESRLGEGSVFVLHLPTAPSRPPGPIGVDRSDRNPARQGCTSDDPM